MKSGKSRLRNAWAMLALLLNLPLVLCVSAFAQTTTPDLGKSLTDGSPVYLGGLPVTASFPSPGYIYVSSAARNAGIRVDTSQSFAEGVQLNISGTIRTDPVSGERYVAPIGSPTPTGGSRIISPTYMPERNLGGGTFGLQLGVTGGSGLNNIGLLAKLSGWVTQIDNDGQYFYLDDKCGTTDGTTTAGTTNLGVRVAFEGRGYQPGQMLLAVGISSCFKSPDGNLRRLLRPRSSSDVKMAHPPDFGEGSDMNRNRPFPYDNPWNQRIDNAEVDPNSSTLIASIGLTGGLHPDFGASWNGIPNGLPYVIIPGNTPKVPVSFYYPLDSDPGPYPIPPDAPIEGGPNGAGDRHILIIDRDNWKLYELFDAYPQGNSWSAGSGAIFDLNSNALRPAGWTSADAAGLPIFPGLARYDEVYGQKAINHALRFTVVNTRHAYVYPATHYASSNTSASVPPMGMRVRLKANYDISRFPQCVQVILTALKQYGMFVADNGSNWHITGAPDSRWNNDELNQLTLVTGSNFEVVKMGTIVTQ